MGHFGLLDTNTSIQIKSQYTDYRQNGAVPGFPIPVLLTPHYAHFCALSHLAHPIKLTKATFRLQVKVAQIRFIAQD